MERTTDLWDALALQVRADLIIMLSDHVNGPRGDEAVEHILRLEGRSERSWDTLSFR